MQVRGNHKVDRPKRNPSQAPDRLRMLPVVGVWIAVAGSSVLAAPGTAPTSPTAAAAEPTTVCASHILVGYWGAAGATDLRTSPTSRRIALDILKRVSEPGADFMKIGREAADRYPDIRVARTGPFVRSNMPEAFANTVFALQPGQIADGLTTTAFGFHIIRRNPTVHCRHILIQYKGASRATVERSRDQARQLAEKVRAEALKPGADVAALARRYSESPDGASGGDVGVFDRDRMIKPFETAAFALGVGDISCPVETRFGFHIIQRIE